jgi:very-short-patch-repair endonuclease
VGDRGVAAVWGCGGGGVGDWVREEVTVPYRKYIKQRTKRYAKHLRWHPTPSEALLWTYLDRDQMGYRCRRQEPILGWIADFYFAKRRLVIELDGSYHTHRKAHDAERDATFLRYKIRTMRIPSCRVFHDIKGVLQDIQRALHSE